MSNNLRIYVADLHAYNSGRLHGVWIDLEEHDYESAVEEVDKMLSGSPCPGGEEYAIHDSEGFGGALGEYTSLVDVYDIGDFFREHGDAARAALSISTDLDEAKKLIGNGWYAVQDLAEYAQDHAESLGLELPLWLHVDWDATGRDVAMDMAEVRYDGVLYLFQPG